MRRILARGLTSFSCQRQLSTPHKLLLAHADARLVIFSLPAHVGLFRILMAKMTPPLGRSLICSLQLVVSGPLPAPAPGGCCRAAAPWRAEFAPPLAGSTSKATVQVRCLAWRGFIELLSGNGGPQWGRDRVESGRLAPRCRSLTADQWYPGCLRAKRRLDPEFGQRPPAAWTLLSTMAAAPAFGPRGRRVSVQERFPQSRPCCMGYWVATQRPASRR